jgi:dTDP-4-dehydrorhamnose reductase
MSNHNKPIIVLGARGLLGHTVFSYLKSHTTQTVMGTSRSPFQDLLVCGEKNIIPIISSLGPLSYIINCIGALPTANTKQSKRIYTAINTSLPLAIASLAEAQRFRFIHISTDGVFPPTSGPVDENVIPSPIDLYGKTKLSGEPRSHWALTIRTSIVGLDPNRHHGLLEWILQNEKKPLHGYTNQIWSGCTSLQLAQFIQWIIHRDRFNIIRAKTPVVHFAPLGPFRKYDLVKSFTEVAHTKQTHLIPSEGSPIQRFLISRYTALQHYTHYKMTIRKALSSLLAFENKSI